jgi:hypothetical protein
MADPWCDLRFLREPLGEQISRKGAKLRQEREEQKALAILASLRAFA